MISVNELIQQAFTRVGLVGDGQAANGTKAKSALHELNDLIQSLNQQEYISDNIKVIELRRADSITIGSGIDFDIRTNKAPSHIKAAFRESGNRFVELVPTSLESILGQAKSHLATQYTYNVEFDPEARTSKRIRDNAIVVATSDELPEATREHVTKHFHWYAVDENSWGFAMGVGQDTYTWATYARAPTQQQLDAQIYEYDKGCIRGTITLDTNRSQKYRIMYLEEIPEYKLDDTIYLQDIYKSLLLAGLTYKLAVRYKLQEWLATYKEDFDDQKSLIKRINQTNRNLTWISKSSSYMDNYYNGFDGGDW